MKVMNLMDIITHNVSFSLILDPGGLEVRGHGARQALPLDIHRRSHW